MLESIGDNSGNSETVRGDRQAWIGTTARRHERAVSNIKVISRMYFAVAINHANFRIGPSAAGTAWMAEVECDLPIQDEHPM